MTPKKILSKTLILLFIISSSSLLAVEQDVIQHVSDALRAGDAVELSKHINTTVEMVILGEENIYSKAQAELLLKDFFSRNTPKDFRVNHQGTKRTTSFAIGMLLTSKGNLRVSLFMKSENGKMLIHQLRIERDDIPVR